MTRPRSSLTAVLLIGFVVVFSLQQFLPVGFVCAGQKASLKQKTKLTQAAVGQSVDDVPDVAPKDIQERVQKLKEASLAACLEASEENEVMAEECATLSYELATAKQLLQMREDEFTFQFLDSDSY